MPYRHDSSSMKNLAFERKINIFFLLRYFGQNFTGESCDDRVITIMTKQT